MRTKIALLAAVVLGFLAAIGVRHYVIKKEEELKGDVARSAIAVAREAINPGDILGEPMIKPREVETAMVSNMHILYHERKSWIGQRVAVAVRAGDPLLKTYFVSGPTPTSADKVQPGWRAVTIGVDQISGVGGLITPASHVDILGTFREQAVGPAAMSPVVTKTLLRNVEVIAVDNRTELTLPSRAGRGAQADRGYSSITLLVTPKEALLLTFAQSSGAKLSCSLRRTDDPQTKDGANLITQSGLDEAIAEAAREREAKIQQATKPGSSP